jgi:hypothetical protein
MNIDDEDLIKALNNDNNNSIIELTSKEIKTTKIDIINNLNLPKPIIKEYLNKLKNYRYIEEIKDVNYGVFIKWISLNENTYLELKGPCITCNLAVSDTGVSIVCKSFTNRIFQINMDNSIIFQKITTQENILLKALDFISEN